MMQTTLTLLAGCRSRAFPQRVESVAATRSATGEPIPGWMKATYAAKGGSATVRVPEGMVYIPAGSYVMGAAKGEISRPSGAGPGNGERGDTRHNVRLSAFCISKYLITNAQYKLFCDAAGPEFRPGGRMRGGGCYWDNPLFDWKRKANHPVLWAGYNQAMAYCQWVSGNTGWKVTLPSEAQWERAARGATQTGEEFEYPWGNSTAVDDYRKRLSFNVLCAIENGTAKTLGGKVYPHWPFVVETRGDAMLAANFRSVVYGEEDDRTPGISGSSDEVKAVWKRIMDRGGHTTAAGSYPAGPENCFDMAGNAFEWTRDYYTISSYMQLAEKTIDPCVEDVSILTADDRKSGSDGTHGGGLEGANGRPTKVIRGGSWYANEWSCRTHRRTETRAAGQGGYHSVGFRVVMIPAV
jgi:formylglycine-generating enzyme required for sulfatase activity